MRAARGKYIETLLDEVCDVLCASGIQAHKNNAAQMIDGTFKKGKGEPFDWFILYNGVAHCFDSKECQADAWPISKATPKQCNALMRCKTHGADAYFLVFFHMHFKCVRFPIDLIMRYKHERISKIYPEAGTVWDWQKVFEIA